MLNSASPTRLAALLPAMEDAHRNALGVGYIVHPFVCSGEVKFGDCVVITTDGEVVLTTTSGEFVNIAGVIVGGEMNGKLTVLSDDNDIGFAFADGTVVLVAVAGSIVKVVAGDTILITDTLIPSDSTAGRVEAGTTARAILGRPLGAALVGETFKALLGA